MKIEVFTAGLYRSITNSADRKRFERYTLSPTIFIPLPDSKTQSQLGAVWRDFTIAGEWLDCDKDVIYGMCVQAEALQEFFFEKVKIKGELRLIFTTLSTFSKEKMSLFIPRMRDYLQGEINKKAGNVLINWSSRENELSHTIQSQKEKT